MKCQLLCRACHIDKGVEDRPEVSHGLYRYEYYRCRCDACRAANAVASARKRQLYPSRADSSAPGTLDLDRSGVAQSAEQPAVNRLVESSSLSPRAETVGKPWGDLGSQVAHKPAELGRCQNRQEPAG